MVAGLPTIVITFALADLGIIHCERILPEELNYGVKKTSAMVLDLSLLPDCTPMFWEQDGRNDPNLVHLVWESPKSQPVTLFLRPSRVIKG
jgi:hypothetical protein